MERLAVERLSDGDYAVYRAISDAVRETARMGTGGVERTYQRSRWLSPLSLDAARAAELGVELWAV